MVGKSTLYKWLHEDKRRGGDLYRFCRHGLRYRRQRLAQPKNSKSEVATRASLSDLISFPLKVVWGTWKWT